MIDKHIPEVTPAVPLFDPETGEILAPPAVESATDGQHRRKASVNRIQPNSRTAKCLRVRIAPTADLLIGSKSGKAHFAGLVRCGSVWVCPVCAAKIAERRREELTKGMRSAMCQGLDVHLVTLTFPHTRLDKLADLMAQLRIANKALSTGRNAIKAQLDGALVGTIRALEVTHGKNGWHPHLHVLVFTKGGQSAEKLKDAYRKAWLQGCARAGLPEPSEEHGVDVRAGDFAATYVSKWGLPEELTKSHMKKSRAGAKGVTPFGLLDAHSLNNNPDYPPTRAATLFNEYADAFRGFRQLTWSKGLHGLLGLGKELTDEELAEQEVETAETAHQFGKEAWNLIVQWSLEPMLLKLAETDRKGLDRVVAALRAHLKAGGRAGAMPWESLDGLGIDDSRAPHPVHVKTDGIRKPAPTSGPVTMATLWGHTITINHPGASQE